MKLLVTGGAGFIGSNFIRYILAQHPAGFDPESRQIDLFRQPPDPAGCGKDDSAIPLFAATSVIAARFRKFFARWIRRDRSFRCGNARGPQHPGRFGLREDQRPGNAVPFGRRPARLESSASSWSARMRFTEAPRQARSLPRNPPWRPTAPMRPARPARTFWREPTFALFDSRLLLPDAPTTMALTSTRKNLFPSCSLAP